MRAPRTVTGSEGRAAERDRSEVRRLSSRLPHFIKRAAGTEEGADLAFEFDGTSADTDAVGGIPADELVSTDGLAPASSPLPIVEGGLRFLCVQITPISNDGPVTYEYHVSDTTGFTPDATTLVTETRGWMQFIRSLADGTPLEYGTTYYVKIVAKDADGSAAPSAEVSAQLDPAGVNDILAGAITAEKLAAVVVLSSLIQTAVSGSRCELDEDGFRAYDSSDVLMVDIPSDGSNPFFDGALFARGLSLAGDAAASTARIGWEDSDISGDGFIAQVWAAATSTFTNFFATLRNQDGDPVAQIHALYDDGTPSGSYIRARLDTNADGTWIDRYLVGPDSDDTLAAMLRVPLFDPIPASRKRMNFGSDTAATNGVNSANKAFNHGMSITPTNVQATARNNVAAVVDVVSITSTQITVRVKHRDAGSNFGANVDFDWLAIG